MNKRMIVIIPIYQNKLDDAEEKSVDLCCYKLGRCYDLCFIVPNSLDMRNYTKYHDIKVKRFPDRFFKSAKTYNKLMLNAKFYKAFSDYEYMLIAQTDTLILNHYSIIEQFMDAGYSYWGAPWEEKQGFWFYTTKSFLYEKYNIGKKFLLRVGNGGFSLRNIRKTLELLKEKWFWKLFWTGNEDFFFSCYGLDNNCGFRVAPLEMARQFALETNMRFNLEHGLKPYAVHKWQEAYPTYDDISPYVYLEDK